MRRAKPLLLFVLLLIAIAFFVYGGSKNAVSESPKGTGIEGEVLLGPQCPGATRTSEECPDKPLSGTFELLDLKGNKVKEFTSDLLGKFSIAVPPGDYSIRLKSSSPFPSCGKSGIVPVETGYVEVIVFCDTGIR